MSEAVQQLNKWLQVGHKVSLVDRHETNGVEGSNKQILRHLRTLVSDFRIANRWSDPIILCLVLFVINDQIHSETGVRPLDAKFGSADGPYLRLPKDSLPSDITNAWVIALDQDLKRIRQISVQYQEDLVKERLKDSPPETQNQFQPGDLVTFRRDVTHGRPSKLSAEYGGPWEVIRQVRNTVMCRHLAINVEKPLWVGRLKLHVGSREEAFELALRDKDQYVVRSIKAWKGDPRRRAGMQFFIEYDDGDEMWVSYKQDLVTNAQYQAFVESDTRLFQLRYSGQDANLYIQAMRKQQIQDVSPGVHVYVDLRRIIGCDNYDELNLPHAHFTMHVCECYYTKWINRQHTRIEAKCILFDCLLKNMDTFDVYQYGTNRVLTDKMTLVTEGMVVQYPQMLSVLPKRDRDALLRRYNGRPMNMVILTRTPAVDRALEASLRELNEEEREGRGVVL